MRLLGHGRAVGPRRAAVSLVLAGLLGAATAAQLRRV
jgi:hypothetical protein